MAETYRLTRSSRKTLAMRVLPDGTVEVRAPLRLAKREIDAFVAKHAAWIASQRDKHKALREAAVPLAEGTLVPFLGESLPLRFSQASFGQKGGCIWLPENLPPEAALEQFYRQEAIALLPPVAKAFAEKMGVSYRRIGITGAKKRWGSCSGKGSINFSWRLMAAPMAAVELVVAHELAHLRQLNHSPAFYKILASVLPDWRERKALLENAGRLPQLP